MTIETPDSISCSRSSFARNFLSHQIRKNCVHSLVVGTSIATKFASTNLTRKDVFIWPRSISWTISQHSAWTDLRTWYLRLRKRAMHSILRSCLMPRTYSADPPGVRWTNVCEVPYHEHDFSTCAKIFSRWQATRTVFIPYENWIKRPSLCRTGNMELPAVWH